LAGSLTLVAVPASAAEPAVSLVVGLRTDADVVDRLADEVDVLDTETLTGAVTVEVPAGQVTEATETLRDDPAVAYVEPNHTAYASVVNPNDPGFSQQWGAVRTRLTTAWQTERGSSDVVIAVVDTGVKALPDLRPRLLTGYDFVNNDSNATDDNGHGTQAAGVAAASANNGVGIAGACWYCRILPVKVLGADGSGSYSDIAQGVRFAADRGANIINLSLGGDEDSQVLRDAMEYAAAKGSLVLAAAGNQGSPVPHFPAAIPSVIAVGASTMSDTRYSWSNYGSGWVDLAAPGCNPAQGLSGSIGEFCGTSSATPLAAGIAALLAGTSPAPTATRIRAALTMSAKPIGNWLAASSGRVDATTSLNSLRAVTVDRTAPATSFRSPASGARVRGITTVSARATDNVKVSKVVLMAGTRVVGTDTTSPYAFKWNTAKYRGAVFLTLKAYDHAGQVTSARRTVRVDNVAPSVLITSAPVNGKKRIRGTANVTARSSDASGINRMELLVNGKIVQRYAGTAHRFAVKTSSFGKVLKVQVRAYDRAGNARVTPVRTWRR
jgi:subtilisin family serine protease